MENNDDRGRPDFTRRQTAFTDRSSPAADTQPQPPETAGEAKSATSIAEASPQEAGAPAAARPVKVLTAPLARLRLNSGKVRALLPAGRRRPAMRGAAEGLLVLIIIALAVWAVSLAHDRSNLQKQVSQLNARLTRLQSDPQALVQQQTQNLLAKVGRLMTLPTGETPTVASVTDVAVARKQSAFFAKAQNGDLVLVYSKAGEAILYRPSTNQVILVAPLSQANIASGKS